MKRIFLLLLFSYAGVTSSLQAQNFNKGNRSEKVQSLKIAFITQKLELTPEQAQKFWPVYNRYETEIRQVVTDNKIGGDAIDNEEKVLNVKKRYRQEFTRIIGEAKANSLFTAEKEFRGVLMRQLKKDGEHRQ
jgi:hypothetical protein